MKIAFIIPYFGKFNNYFQLFLDSCSWNTEFSWLIFTDDHTGFNYPSNVNVFYMTFEDICRLIHNKVSKTAVIDRPYKLCDYKPCYGLIFEEYLISYDFWGYCDVDMIFGKIAHFIKPEILAKYDKIFFLGHCTLIRNSNQTNKAFWNEPEFIRVCMEDNNHSFDEEFRGSINNIFKRKNLQIYLEEFEANLYVKSSYFIITRYDFSKDKYIKLKMPGLFFIWEKGVLTGIWGKNGVYNTDEFLYIHFQSRPMKNRVTSCEKYKIIPNSFENVEDENLGKVKRRHFNIHYFKVRGRNLMMKIQGKSKRR